MEQEGTTSDVKKVEITYPQRSAPEKKNSGMGERGKEAEELTVRTLVTAI